MPSHSDGRGTAATSMKRAAAGPNADAFLAARRKAAQSAAKMDAASIDESKFVKIKDNPFHKIMASAATPEEKRDAITQALVFDPNKSEKENAQRIEEYKLFNEWMQNERKKMAVQLIKLNDTEAFAELRSVIDDMSRGIAEFNTRIQPFVDILEAVYAIRLSGVNIADMANEIQKDKEEEERLNGVLQQQNQAVTDANAAIQALEEEKIRLANQKSWWTLGMKTKPSAVAEMQIADRNIAAKKDELATLATQIGETQTAIETPRETQFAALVEAKGGLRQLLDISADGLREDQRALIEAANDFVLTSDQRVGSVLSNIDAMTGRIEDTASANGQMLGAYAIMNDSVKNAMDQNQGVLAAHSTPVEGASAVEDMQRRDLERSIQRHVQVLTTARTETTTNYDALTKERAELEGMRTSNMNQVNDTRSLHTAGIASMGMHLNSVLQAIASAGNDESRQAAQSMIDQMSATAADIKNKEVIRTALQFDVKNEAIERAIAIAEEARENLKASRDIQFEGLTRLKQNLGTMEVQARDLSSEIDKNLGVYADADAAVANVEAGAETTAKPRANDNKGGLFGGGAPSKLRYAGPM